MGAGRQVDEEEVIQFGQRSDNEEDRVHHETSDADFPIEFEFVQNERPVQEYECREQRYRAVDEAVGVYLHVARAGYLREENSFEEPWQAQTQQHVEDVRAYGIADSHCAVA